MRLLADENIPFVAEAFAGWGPIRTKAGRAITAADVAEADLLLVRSVTHVDDALLGTGRVRFVGSATIGTDHIDLGALRARGITFAHAPGSNADSVVEYVLTALLTLASRRQTTLRGQTIGLVGCGQIGHRLARRLPALGMRVLRNDPPLAAQAEAEGLAHPFIGLDQLLAEADIVSLHVPLTRTGPHPTHHLIDAHALARMNPHAWLINTCRGAVVANAALLEALEADRLGAAVLDVWENEPTPDPALMARVALATPHIAGYSFDGKVAGTIMLYEAACRFFDRPATWHPESVLKPDHPLVLHPIDPHRPEPLALADLALQAYPIWQDDARMRGLSGLPLTERGAAFSQLRKTYPRRRTFGRYTLAQNAVPPVLHQAITEGLGFAPPQVP